MQQVTAAREAIAARRTELEDELAELVEADEALAKLAERQRKQLPAPPPRRSPKAERVRAEHRKRRQRSTKPRGTPKASPRPSRGKASAQVRPSSRARTSPPAAAKGPTSPAARGAANRELVLTALREHGSMKQGALAQHGIKAGSIPALVERLERAGDIVVRRAGPRNVTIDLPGRTSATERVAAAKASDPTHPSPPGTPNGGGPAGAVKPQGGAHSPPPSGTRRELADKMRAEAVDAGTVDERSNEERAIDLLRERELSSLELARALGLPSMTARSLIGDLEAEGKIARSEKVSYRFKAAA